ncbi:MAG: DUF4910 domain-containing protein [Anaerolineae bacterium]|nr:DUF4910 domain-containing protein [Anaerolineae bacterium]
MFKSLWEVVEREVSGPAAKLTVAEIARYHRIQASPGFRHAAAWVHQHLAAAGLSVRTLTFPANTETSFWSASSFQEWEASAATLHLIEPADKAQKLADYRDVPLNLIVRSLPFDGEAEVVVLERGEDAAEYEGLDVAGKVVLARGNVKRVHDLAVRRRGALGILYDGMAELEWVRPAWELPDTVQYTSFWWYEQEPRGFGFALTPRQGEALRRLAREHTLRVRAHVASRLFDGEIEVVEATIPGTTDEEIVMVAHLCHPLPSANDNGSGVAALMEVARALHALIERGDLAQPRRSIRFLWLPEMTGTFAYLAAHEARIPCMVAGLNLDMVGQDQDQCGSSFLIERPPDALTNFTDELLTCLRKRLLPEVQSFSNVGGYPLFRYADVPFSGGSDHYIFSDPTVGVPMPMLIQWPDRYYHTSDDTPDRVDPAMMARVGRLAAVYAYWLAQAGDREARWLASEMSAQFRQLIIVDVQDAVTCCDEEETLNREVLRKKLAYRIARHHKALETVKRLAPIDVTPWSQKDTEFAESEWTHAAALIPDRSLAAVADVEGSAGVPVRCFPGPVQIGAFVDQLNEAGRDRWYDLQKRLGDVSRILPVLAEYWADGHRTIAEIAGLVKQETGRESTALLVEYFSELSKLGLIKVR